MERHPRRLIPLAAALALIALGLAEGPARTTPVTITPDAGGGPLAGPAPAPARVLHSWDCTAEGPRAACTASRLAVRPRSVTLYATASPPQQVTVWWTMTCTEGSRTATASGHYTGEAPVREDARMPLAAPGSCWAGADLELRGQGRGELRIRGGTSVGPVRPG